MQSVFSRGSGDDCIRITLTGKDLSGVSDEDVSKAVAPLGENGEFFPGFGIKGIVGKVLQQKFGGGDTVALAEDSADIAAGDAVEQPAVEDSGLTDSLSATGDTVETPAVEDSGVTVSQPKDTASAPQEASETLASVLDVSSQEKVPEKPVADTQTNPDSTPTKYDNTLAVSVAPSLASSDAGAALDSSNTASSATVPKADPIQEAAVESKVSHGTSYEDNVTVSSLGSKSDTTKEDTTKESETLGKVSPATEEKKVSDTVVPGVLPKSSQEEKMPIVVDKEVVKTSGTEVNAGEGSPEVSAVSSVKESLPSKEITKTEEKNSYVSNKAAVNTKLESSGSEVIAGKLSKESQKQAPLLGTPKPETKVAVKPDLNTSSGTGSSYAGSSSGGSGTNAPGSSSSGSVQVAKPAIKAGASKP